MRYERLLQPPAEAGAHHPAQQESEQSGDPAARYRLHPGPAAGAGDAPGSAEAAAAAGAAAPPGRDLSGRAAADPAHGAQHRPGERPAAGPGRTPWESRRAVAGWWDAGAPVSSGQGRE